SVVTSQRGVEQYEAIAEDAVASVFTDPTRRELQFSGFELASRLSFLLWNSLPDETLLDDAASGVLDTAEGVLTAASRMLDAPRGRQAIGAFAEEYMRLDRVATQAKDADLFPEYTPELQAAMTHDMRGAWESIAFNQESSAFE